MNITSHTITAGNPWDKAGTGASILCVLHCLLTPVLITVVPALAATEHQTHSVLALFMLLFGALAFVPGYRRHRRRIVPAAGAAGLTLIIAATLLPESANREILETLMVVTGGVLLITAHLRNAYWCRLCRACCEQEDCTATAGYPARQR